MKKLLILITMLITFAVKGQSFYTAEQSQALLGIKNDKSAQKFEPYVRAKHGAGFDFESFKKNQKMEFYKELWYYSKSFYIKNNYLSSGHSMDESMIDISRFDSARKFDEETIIKIDGFKDVIVLSPTKKLLFTND